MAELTQDQKVGTIFDALDCSKVSMTDFARITKISRETLYRWKNGNPITDNLRLDFAYGAAVRLKKACTAKRLPLTERLKKEQRVNTLRSIIREMATQ